ncbi:MAG: sigma-54-dependent Fis family transcriptional regulator [Deltaproteobacteria bacterium]|nr:sigma-54-dependent Fis family transcriptional regulator [Deltaproteobacteria bacterium]
MIGRSAAMRDLGRFVRRVARTSLPVLIRGETGSGKELVARALHELGPRRGKPLVVINAAMIVGDLGASQLFGHATGAFTGATTPRRGAFREAHQGALFLDELGALPIESQAKLLRVLEDGVVSPIGSDMPIKVDVRVLAATCEPLERRVAEGTFRRDLFERLSVCTVAVPSLEERREDIPELARWMLACSEFSGLSLSPRALSVLQMCELPGNVRGLRNILIQSALSCAGETIEAEDVLRALGHRSVPQPPRPPLDSLSAHALLHECSGNQSDAARRAQLPRSTFRDLLRKTG